MDDTPLYRLRGTLRGDRIITRPMTAKGAFWRAQRMKAEGYCDLMLTDLETGEEVHLEIASRGRDLRR